MRSSDWSSDVCSSDLRNRVPQLLDIVDGDGEGLRERLLREPRRHPDAHSAERELEQSIAPIGIEPVEQRREDRGGGAAGGGRERVDGFGDGQEIGRASRGEGVWQYVLISVVPGALKKK